MVITRTLMGRAGKAVNDQLNYGVAFLGDCAQVSNLNGAKSRTSASIAHHLLQYEFPERLQQGKYGDSKSNNPGPCNHIVPYSLKSTKRVNI